jgi:hypothetical protein
VLFIINASLVQSYLYHIVKFAGGRLIVMTKRLSNVTLLSRSY